MSATLPPPGLDVHSKETLRRFSFYCTNEEAVAFQLFFQLPAGWRGTELAISATRAGAIGVINAELGADPRLIESELRDLASFGGGCFGLSLDELTPELLKLLPEAVGKGLRWLFLDCGQVDAPELAPLRALELRVVARVRGETLLPSPSLCDAIVVKGHEAGGRVGEESSFVLMQRWLRRTSLPVFVHGGLSPSTASACHAVGAQGGVFDSQLLLFNECGLSDSSRSVVIRLSGTETQAVGDPETGDYFRVLVRHGFSLTERFSREARDASGSQLLKLAARYALESEENAPISERLCAFGQDSAFAKDLSTRFERITDLVRGVDEAIETTRRQLGKGDGLLRNSKLAAALGTKHPIVQGPMTRVSDRPEFAQSIAEGGALPMVAVALLKGERLATLLEKTQQLLQGKAWGIGLLGFAPRPLLEEQLEVALRYSPSFAIVAGGRPDQVVELEAAGIPSFLHLPSEALLPLFLEEGARKFIFEGRECGGHTGPLSSLVLWGSMLSRLLHELEENPDLNPEEIQVLFAGGIHDSISAAYVQALCAPLAERGVKTGILMGSAYLFTEEIVDTGAIVEGFQAAALACDKTVNLESGPGHASRCAYTPFASEFFAKKREVEAQEEDLGQQREQLDRLILGRLRLASKGQERNGDEILDVSAERQAEEGMFMIGQVATLRKETTSVESLHQEVTAEAEKHLEDFIAGSRPPTTSASTKPANIAIVGIASLLPGAKSSEEYWENILDKRDAITEVPRTRWDTRLYFDEDKTAPDKVYSRWGGFLDDLLFDPVKYGMPPRSVESVDPMQLLALEVAANALSDAGYADRPFDRSRASVFVGAGGGTGDVGIQYGVRSELPRFLGELPSEAAARLPEWTEDTFAGILNNVIAGRIANRLNFGVPTSRQTRRARHLWRRSIRPPPELANGRTDLVIARVGRYGSRAIRILVLQQDSGPLPPRSLSYL